MAKLHPGYLVFLGRVSKGACRCPSALCSNRSIQQSEEHLLKGTVTTVSCPVPAWDSIFLPPPCLFWNPRRGHSLGLSTPLQPRLRPHFDQSVHPALGSGKHFLGVEKVNLPICLYHLRPSLINQKPNVRSFAASASHVLRSQGTFNI